MYKAKLTGKRQITVPKVVCEELELEEGDKLVFSKEEGKYKVEKERSGAGWTCSICRESVVEENFVQFLGKRYHVGCWNKAQG